MTLPGLLGRGHGLLMRYLASPTSAGKSEGQAQSFPSPHLTLISCLSFASNCDSSASGLFDTLDHEAHHSINPVPLIPRQPDLLAFEGLAPESGQFDDLHSHPFLICPALLSPACPSGRNEKTHTTAATKLCRCCLALAERHSGLPSPCLYPLLPFQNHPRSH